MKSRQCTVTVIRLLETARTKEAQLFCREFETRMNPDRPCMVLDCSKVIKMERVAILMLLCCLEAAIMRNGDVKLAAVTPSARETLGLAGADRLFEIYDTETEAVNSYLLAGSVQKFYARASHDSDQVSDSAA
jgi:anti-anti-sigma regulatory factor